MGGISSKNACKAIKQAGVIARTLQQEMISTEHLLLGVIDNADNGASKILKALGIDIDAIRRDVESIATLGNNISGKPYPSPRAKKAIENSIAESNLLEDGLIRTEYILLGFLHEEDTSAAQVLLNHGLRLEETREKIREIIPNSRIKYKKL